MAPKGSDPRQIALFEAYQQSGEIELRNELVEAHLDLASGFARRYRQRGVALDDLEQVARLGLVGAVERFDPSVGVRFETFAGRTIDGELKRHFRDKAWSVRVPRAYQDLGIAIRSVLDELSKELGRSPTIPELAESVGADIDEVLAAMDANQAFKADSIDAPVVDDDGATTVGQQLASIDAGPARFDDRALVADLLQRLPSRERRIVELRFFHGQSQRQIADEIGISQMHVSRLLRGALATLREELAEE